MKSLIIQNHIYFQSHNRSITVASIYHNHIDFIPGLKMSSLSICILAELHYVWKAGTYKNFHFYLHDDKLQKSGLSLNNWYYV